MAIITKPTSKSAYWGVVPTAGDTFADARITKMEVGDEGSLEPLPDKQGETTGLCGYDRKRPASLEIIVDSAAAAPEFMDDIVVLGITINVEKCRKMWEHKGWQKLAIDGTGYPNLEAAQGLSTLPLGHTARPKAQPGKPEAAKPEGK